MARKRKFAMGDRVIGNDKRSSFCSDTGTIDGQEPGSQYWVQFDNGRRDCLPSDWLDPLP